MEKDDKGSTLIRIGVSGESSFWYRPTRVVPDQRPLNGRCCNGSLIDYCVTALSCWPSLTAETTDRKLDLDAAVSGDAV